MVTTRGIVGVVESHEVDVAVGGRLPPGEVRCGGLDGQWPDSENGSPRREARGYIARWHVDDTAATVRRLLDLGAREHEPVVEREAGFVNASVVDPFGNIIGLITSSHYLEKLPGGS